jgi:hypothetical protein
LSFLYISEETSRASLIVDQSLRDVARLIAVLSWKNMNWERDMLTKSLKKKILTQLEGRRGKLLLELGLLA